MIRRGACPNWIKETLMCVSGPHHVSVISGEKLKLKLHQAAAGKLMNIVIHSTCVQKSAVLYMVSA